MYTMLGTWLDLVYAVSLISWYTSNPTQLHYNTVKCIFHYLQRTVNLRLVFRRDLERLADYSDADWAGDLNTWWTTSEYIFNLGSGAISWSSKRQPVVALSSCEAEYMGQTQAAKEAIWLGKLLNQLNSSEQGLHTTIIYCDNQGAIALAKNLQYHAWSKHINIQYHFVREKVTEGKVQLKYVATEKQVTDSLTKPLCKDKFVVFQKALSLEDNQER